MRNPGGKGFSRGHPMPFRNGRRDRRAAEKSRLKPACSREERPPWSPKESNRPSRRAKGFIQSWGWAWICPSLTLEDQPTYNHLKVSWIDYP